MSLIEIMVVIALVGLVTAVIGVSVFGVYDDGKVKITRQQIEEVQKACEVFRLQTGAYPSTSAGISALWQPTRGRALLEKPPQDAWGRPLRYAFPGAKSAKGVDIWSAGENGVDGDEDDLGNW